MRERSSGDCAWATRARRRCDRTRRWESARFACVRVRSLHMRRLTIAAALCACLCAFASLPSSARATTRHCAPVTFERLGVADFGLHGIRTTNVRCELARKVVRGARLHERWRSHGFSCKATRYVPEVRTYFRCRKGRRAIRFHT